ncbi:MAG: pyrroline-5-carboxylate reductase [Planctomycetota bacterium]
MRYKLGFIGCGNMAQAIAGGAIKGGVLQASDVIASDPSSNNRAVFQGWGCGVSDENGDVIAQSQQILLAVKPQVFPVVAADLDAITEEQVLISIMAGVSSAGIIKLLGRPCRVVRVMPNTPALVGAGMAGIALGDDARPGDDELSKQLFGAVGEVVELKEPMIDAINAISGSGPGYVFYFAEALEEAAAELGLGRSARKIVAQTFFGAGKLMLESGEDPAELRRKVTSPGGTTLAATESLDHDRVKEAIQKAVRAAFTRAQELGA